MPNLRAHVFARGTPSRSRQLAAADAQLFKQAPKATRSAPDRDRIPDVPF